MFRTVVGRNVNHCGSIGGAVSRRLVCALMKNFCGQEHENGRNGSTNRVLLIAN